MNKFLKQYLKTFSIIFVLIVIVKICGLNQFGIDYDNKVIRLIDDFANKYYLVDLIKAVILFINTYVIVALTCNDYSYKSFIYTLITMLFVISYKIFISKLGAISLIIDFIAIFIIVVVNYFVINKRNFKLVLINYLVITIINFIYQLFSNIIRNIDYKYSLLFSEYIILNLDYISLLLITYFYFKIKKFENKEDINLWTGVVGSSGDLLRSCGQLLVSFGVSLKSHITSLLESSKKQRTDGTKEKKSKKNQKLKNLNNDLGISITFFILYFIWNCFTVFFILFIADINDTLIECFIMLIAFFFNKAVFGKPLHLKKASSCFIISNIAWWMMNRITLPKGISIVVPVLLGISLALVQVM